MFSLKCWRNTHGFGVHSPFGYDIARYVVNPRKSYSYYGYKAIDAACEKDGCSRHVRREARMFLRLAAMLHIDSAFLPTGVHPAYHAALKASDGNIRIERKIKNAPSCTLMSSHGDFLSLDTLRSHISVPGHVVALLNAPEGWKEELFEAMPEGLMIYGRKNVFLISRPEMQKVSYFMKI